MADAHDDFAVEMNRVERRAWRRFLQLLNRRGDGHMADLMIWRDDRGTSALYRRWLRYWTAEPGDDVGYFTEDALMSLRGDEPDDLADPVIDSGPVDPAGDAVDGTETVETPAFVALVAATDPDPPPDAGVLLTDIVTIAPVAPPAVARVAA